MFLISTRWTCTLTLQRPATWCSQDWTRTLQSSWHWIFLRLREHRSPQTDTALIRVQSSYSIFNTLLSHSSFHISYVYKSMNLLSLSHLSHTALLIYCCTMKYCHLNFHQGPHANKLTGQLLLKSHHTVQLVWNNSSFLCTCPSNKQEVRLPVLPQEAQTLRWVSWPRFSTVRPTSSSSR